MNKTIEFFWEPGSPYTYLAATQIEALAKDCGATVVWKPFLLGKVFEARKTTLPASIPQKASYMFKDLARWAQVYRVPVTMPKVFPVHSLAASRCAIATLSRVVAVITPVSMPTSRFSGTKPSPIPSMPWGPHWRRARIAHSAGSTA